MLSFRFFPALIAASALAQEAPTFQDGQDPSPKGSKWTLVDALSDEFNAETIDLKKWQIKPLGNGWVWDGRPPGLFHERNVSLKDGNMCVTVGKLPEPLKQRGRTYLYEGAIVRSLEPGQKGWYYETRMKANATEMSSTFWLMTKGNHKKKLELDIQECVGVVSPLAHDWVKDWDEVYHSNLIHRRNRHNPEKVQRQGFVNTPTKNHEAYYVYGAWWKNEKEVLFFLNGKYVYTIKAPIDWDVPAFIQMAIETYDWNAIPEDGGVLAKSNEEERTTKYDWVRVWKLGE